MRLKILRLPIIRPLVRTCIRARIAMRHRRHAAIGKEFVLRLHRSQPQDDWLQRMLKQFSALPRLARRKVTLLLPQRCMELSQNGESHVIGLLQFGVNTGILTQQYSMSILDLAYSVARGRAMESLLAHPRPNR